MPWLSVRPPPLASRLTSHVTYRYRSCLRVMVIPSFRGLRYIGCHHNAANQDQIRFYCVVLNYISVAKIFPRSCVIPPSEGGNGKAASRLAAVAAATNAGAVHGSRG